jgi:hypothetical protein
MKFRQWGAELFHIDWQADMKQIVTFFRNFANAPVAAHLLRSWVRIPPGVWIFVCCECRVLSGRGFCDELITRPEESYRLCRVVVCNLGTSRIGAPYIYIYIYIYIYDISSLTVIVLTLIFLTCRKW